MNTDNDIKLLLNSQKGDKQSLELLFNKYYQKGLNVSYKIVNSLETAEDIVMDAFLSVYNLRITKEINFNSYFMRIIVNKSLNEIKKNSRVIAEYNDDILTDNASDPSVIVNKKLMLEDGKLLLNQLPLTQKTALILVKYEGYTYKEAAEIMNTTEKSVEALLWRARKKLNTLIGEKK